MVLIYDYDDECDPIIYENIDKLKIKLNNKGWYIQDNIWKSIQNYS
jgi:hypothetical protein